MIEIRIHKGYVATTYKHDIAILKIHRPTIFNTYIWPICLPPVGAVFENRRATVIGKRDFYVSRHAYFDALI